MSVNSKSVGKAHPLKFILIWEDPEIVVYMGESRDYVIVNRSYCSCPQFTLRLRRGEGACKHLNALKSLPRASIKKLELDKNGVVSVVSEIISTGFSALLRKRLFT